MIIAYEPSNDYFDIVQKHHTINHNIEFYNSLYTIKNRPGYRREVSWNEYPLWIANLHRLVGINIKVYSDIRRLITFIEVNPDEQFDIYFYALEATEDHIRGIIKILERFGNVTVFGNSLIADVTVEVKSIEEIASYYNTTVTDANIPIVEVNGNPRIYSTIGCNGLCTFCTISNKTTMLNNIQNLTSFTSQLGKQITIAYSINQDFLDENQFKKISKIMFSPKVYMWTGKKWIEVLIDSKIKYANKLPKGNIEFDLTLPERVTQSI